MALIECYECGHKISDKAVACPQCGAPNQKADKEYSQLKSPIKSQKEKIFSWLRKKLNRDNRDTTKTSEIESSVIPPKLGARNSMDVLMLPNSEKELNSKLEDSAINEIIIKRGKVNIVSGILLVLYLSLLSALKFRSDTYPELSLIILSSAVLFYRDIFRKITYKLIDQRKAINVIFDKIYFPALGGYLYRSLLTTLGIALMFEVFAGTSFGMYYGGWTGTLIAYWMAGSIFIFDVPFWIDRKLAKLSKHYE